MYAAFYKYPELVKLLIEHKADINAKNNDGKLHHFHTKLNLFI